MLISYEYVFIVCGFQRSMIKIHVLFFLKISVFMFLLYKCFSWFAEKCISNMWYLQMYMYIYMTKLLFRIETVVQMNLKGCKCLLYNIQTVQYMYFRLQIYNMDFMHTQFIYVYNYLIGSYWIGLEKCWSLCHDVFNFTRSICSLQWKS